MGVTHVGMEGTGVYWKPVYAALEGRVRPDVGNATICKNVPGRKTDVKDAEWIASWSATGWSPRASCRRPRSAELRDIVRHRKTLVER